MRKVRGALLAAVMVLTGFVAGVPHVTAAGNYQVSIDDASATEGTPLAFVISVVPTPAAGDAVTVRATTNSGSATGGGACPAADFVTRSANVVLNSANPTATFSVQTCDDAADEPGEGMVETMSVALSSASVTCGNTTPCTLAFADPTAVGTIVDNDGPSAPPSLPPTPSGPTTLEVVDVNGPVGKTEDCKFSVNRLGSTAGTTTVSFFSAAKSKLAANVAGTLLFAPGETVKQVDVDVLKRPRHRKFVTLFLAGASGATITDGTGLCALKTRRKH